MKPHMATRRNRAKKAAELDGISKKTFVEETGFSEHQWYSWFGDGKEQHAPTLAQSQTIMDSLGWCALFIFHGIGPHRLAELLDILGVDYQTKEHREGAYGHRLVSQHNSETLERLEKRMKEVDTSAEMMDRKLDQVLELLRGQKLLKIV